MDTFKKKLYGTSECIQELFFILYNLMKLAEKYAEVLSLTHWASQSGYSTHLAASTFTG